MSEQLKQLEKLARQVTSETLHGPLPLKTSMRLASDVLTACDLVRTARSDLARKALVEIETMPWRLSFIETVKRRLRDFFTREGITLGDANEQP